MLLQIKIFTEETAAAMSRAGYNYKKKSEAKMREIIDSGATTILVSHSLAQMRELCSKEL